MMNNQRGSKMSQEQWLKIIKQLSPRDVKIVEESIRLVQGKNGRYSTSSAPYSTTFRHGKTIENGRRNLKSEPVSDDEADRRMRRRERNRVAAAKCRQRRQDQIDDLQEQVNKLKKCRHDLHNQLASLDEQREKLKKMIALEGQFDLNDSLNGANSYPTTSSSTTTDVYKVSSTTSSICTVESDGLVNMDLDAPELKIEPEEDSLLSQTTLPFVSRPSSLPIMHDNPVSSYSLTRITPLLTPSTANFLNIPTSGSSDLNTPTDFNQIYQSGYLSLLSPSMDHSPCEMPNFQSAQ